MSKQEKSAIFKYMETLPLELKKLGFSEKEAKVYLAVLRLKYSPVQKIAQETKISRTTTYEILKSLKRKNLIIKHKEKGKSYFSGESPDHLLGILRTQKKELEEKEREFLRIISDLKNKYQTEQEKQIQNYDGENTIKFLLENLETSQEKKIYVFASSEKPLPFQKRNQIYQKIKKRLGGLEVKEVNTLKNKTTSSYTKTKTISKQKLPFRGVAIIYDKILLLESPKKALLIDNPQSLKLLKSLFQVHWQ